MELDSQVGGIAAIELGSKSCLVFRYKRGCRFKCSTCKPQKHDETQLQEKQQHES